MPDNVPGEAGQFRRLDPLCDSFEQAWRNDSGPQLEQYLAGEAGAERAWLLRELLLVELAYRRRRGDQPHPAEYHLRFPDLLPLIDATFRAGEALPAPEMPTRLGRPGVSTAPQPLTVAGYEVLEELGYGGMGIVYRARDVRLKRLVALKMILVNRHGGRHLLARFQAEAEVVARLQHPNIVQIHEVGQHDGLPFLVLEYVEGGNLARRLAEAPLVPLEAARLTRTLALAVHAAHQKNVIHRDLKPANVLLTADGTPKITDFGLAKQLDAEDRTESGVVMGTPSYMAPEQASGQTRGISPAIDIYALGALLYEMLTGHPPFRGASLIETLDQVRNQEPVTLRRLQPGVPRDLETICLKCLHKEPGKRYATAQALADDLQRFLDGEPIQARPVSNGERVLRWCRRRPALAALLVVTVLLLGIVVVGGPLAALRIAQQRDLAENRARETREALWRSSLQQGRAERRSGQLGQRFAGLEALARAAAIRPSLEVRNEAIACLALPDLRVARQWDGNPMVDVGLAFDSALERYARIDEGAISVRQVADDRELFSLPSPGARAVFSGLRFSEDGRFLAAQHDIAERGWHCVIWDLERRQTTLTVPCYPLSLAFAFSPQSNRVAIAHPSGAVVIYEPESGKRVQRLEKLAGLNRMAFDPTGKLLAVSIFPTRTVEVRAVDTGEVVTSLGHPRRVSSIAWGDGGRLLATGMEDGTVYVWEVASRRQLATLHGHNALVIALMFNPAGNVLVSAGWDDLTRLWDVFTGRHLVAAPGVALGFRADGLQLAYRRGDQLGVWEAAFAAECRTLVHGRGIPDPTALDYKGPWSLAYSPDGRLLASSGGDGVRLWDPLTGRERLHLATTFTDSVLFHPQGTHLVSYGSAGITCWPLESDPSVADDSLVGPLRLLEGPTNRIRHSRMCCWGPEGRSLAVIANRDDNLVVVRPFEAPGDPVELKGRPARVSSVAMSPDGRWLAVGAHQMHGIQVWEMSTGKKVKDLPGSRPGAGGAGAAFSPDRQWLVAGGQGEYRFWRVGTWEPGLVIPRSQLETGAGRMAFTRDGKVLAVAWSRQSIRLVDTATGKELATLTSPEPQPITQICFSPDEQQLAVATENRVIHLWDLRRLQRELAELGLAWNMTAR